MEAPSEIICVSNLSKSFGGLPVLRDISFAVRRGEVVSVIGPSGSGKSTLLRCVTGLETADGGTIQVDGEDFVRDGRHAGRAAQRRIGLKLGLVFQNFNLFPHFSVLRNLTEAQIHVLKRPRAEAERRARELLAKMGLPDKERAYPFELSGGQQQRVSIARAMALDPEVLFFDEPTSALDPELTGEVLKVMEKLAQEHMTMIVVTHEMSFARSAASKILFMNQGIILEEGTPDEIFMNPKQPRTKEFLSSIER